MHTFAKKRLHSAIAAALVGIGSAAMTSQALAQQVTNVGQALVFPFYTVNNGWVTTVKAINTTEHTLAVKVRFHESKNSRDVLDFNVIMSPYDVWSGWIQEGADGAPQFFTTDTSCTSPASVNGASASDVAYTGAFLDGGGSGQGRMREGYVEMLVMGVAPGDNTDPAATNGWEDATDSGDPVYPTPYYAKHVDGIPRNCAAVDEGFLKTVTWTDGDDPLVISAPALCTKPAGFYVPGGSPGNGNPEAACDFVSPTNVLGFGVDVNPLKGNLSWLHAATGTGAGTEAIAVRDWWTLNPQNAVTAQEFPWFLEPTFAAVNGLWTVTGVGAFEGNIQFASTLNEWADNPTNGAVVDWVVNFPTKGYHVDQFNEQIQAAVSKYRNALAPVVEDSPAGSGVSTNCDVTRTACSNIAVGPITVNPFEYLFGVQGDGDSKISVTYNIYDSEEGGVATGSTTISPAPPGEIESLRWEANVVQFSLAESVVDSSKPVVVDASGLLSGAVNGWAQLDFTEAYDSPTAPQIYIGLPVVSFAIKERDRGDPGTAYGQAMDNGYIPVP